MLFSHPDVARHMSQLFECAWDSVRPVPHVSIDFGNGRTLERTLHGNVATYFCTTEGAVFDLIPGLVDAREYVRRLDQAQRLNRALGWSRMNVEPSVTVFNGPRAKLPMKGGVIPALSEPLVTVLPPLLDPKIELLLSWHSAVVDRGFPENGDPINVFDGSKMRVERQIDMALAPLGETDAASLAADTLHNRTRRYPLASQLLLEHPFARPSEITAEVYRRVLGVDLADPYLGLAPDVLGGEGGRG